MKKRRERNECGGLSACSYGRTDQPWRIQRSIGMKQAVHGWLSTYERLVKSQNFFSFYLTQEDLSRIGRAVFCPIEPAPCCGHLNFACSSLSANQHFQHIHDLAVLNVGGIGKLLAVLFPHGFEFPAALDVVQNGGYIRNLPGCTAMGCGGV